MAKNLPIELITQSTGVRSVISSSSGDANGKLSVPSMNPPSTCHVVTEDDCSRDKIQFCREIPIELISYT